MAYVAQRSKNDCGVAALAMLCNVTYEEAEVAIPWGKHGLLYGTDTKMLRAGGLKLGYITRSTPKHRLKVVPGCSWAKKRSWPLIPSNSLVKIPAPHGWHWVVWKKGKIYDPARGGAFKPERHGGVPYSYMEFVLDLSGGL